MTRNCWIGIGANIGDARAAFDGALSQLHQHPQINLQKRSGIYRSTPMGEFAGGTFSNAVLSLNTSLPPMQLLTLLHEIEANLGRIRDLRWGPRTIDLDLLVVDQLVSHDPSLTIPHPAAWYRRFVLDPLVEVDSTLRHPLLNATFGELQKRLDEKPTVIGFSDPAIMVATSVSSEVAARFPDVRFESRAEHPSQTTVCIHIDPAIAAVPVWNGIPVADLSAMPGTLVQRIIDFCTAILDKPIRVGDW